MKLKLQPVIKLQKLALHVCDKCKKVYGNPSDLEEHTCHYVKRFYEHVVSAYVAVKRMQIHKCESCVESFKTTTEYLLHKFEHVRANMEKGSAMESTVTNGHNILKPYKCPDCNIKFAAQSTLEQHLIVHMPYPHICHCGIGYYKQKDLIAHIKLVHRNHEAIKDIKTSHYSIPRKSQDITEPREVKKPILVENNKCFKNNVKIKCNKNGGLLKDIEITVTDDNSYKCPLCSSLFKTKIGVFLHYRVHTNARTHTCYLCTETMNTVDSLRLHMKEHHNTNKICVCKYCPKTYVAYAHRSRHEQLHANEKSLSRYYRYKCPYCIKTFSDANTFRAHKLRHGQYPKKRAYICDYCERSFKLKSNLVTHISGRVCTKKHFDCDYYRMKFAYKPYVRKHILGVHDKFNIGQELECNDCSKKFTLKEVLLKHYLSTHSHIQCRGCGEYFASNTDLERHKQQCKYKL